MERSIFSDRLRVVSALAIECARRHVIETLPDAPRFAMQAEVHEFDGVVERLWQDGSTPHWIDINAESCEPGFTLLRLRYSRRWVARDEGLLHKADGFPPFQVLSPSLPVIRDGRWDGGRFELNRPRNVVRPIHSHRATPE